ncbi:CBM35 domain-containing protein [Anaeromassilibacillus senegalensis]|uniref:CBM35 domain-containing protein n=1 Tax=Anaeromassilibacillus senegalensis TaxID=1673717 RepID=UPI000681AAA3|nr:CBM35 domain-containing protein [Anaeromassilibacillus senegalensis]
MIKRLTAVILALMMVLSTLTGLAAARTEPPRVGSRNYYSNQGDLEPSPFVQLPMSAVQAKDWLKQQLLLQKHGMTGEMHDLYEMYKSSNGWRGGSGDGWERGPYYARGLISLAFVLDDAELQEKAMEWIDFSLDHQRENGFFGPLADGDGTSAGWDWWPRMIMIEAIRDYYEYTEYTGVPDERVLPFFKKYFRFQHDRLPGYPVTSWAAARAGDNAEVVLWYYNRVYDPEDPASSAWLIEVAQELMKNSHGIFGNYNDWTTIFHDSTVRNHVVNTTQAMKSPPVQYQFTGAERDRTAIREGIFNMGIDHARVDGLANSDEWARDNLPHMGAELCSVVESLQSYGVAMRILGDSWIGDDMERVAYNNLPAGYTPDFTAHNYFQAQSQMMATNGAHEFIHDHGNSSAFAAPAGDACCISNMHMGWPKFIQNMWMATADDGLAVISYGPNRVQAKVADGKTAVFDQETKYPFDGAIALHYEGESAQFPLLLRVPDWCESPSFTVNGEPAEGILSNGYFTIDREWAFGDTVDVDFPMEIHTSTWYNNSTAVERGPLIYTIHVKEDWHTPDPEMDDPRVLKMSPGGVAPTKAFPSREVTPASRWNYALVYDQDDPSASFDVTVADEIALQPFHTANAPVTIRATGQIVPEWQLLNNVVPEPPYSPIQADPALQEQIELVPYGCSRLRIVQMPRVGDAEETVVRKAREADSKTLDGEPVLEFDNVIVPNAENYQLKISYRGAGRLRLNLNAKYNQEIDFAEGGEPVVIDNLVGLLPAQEDSMLGTTVKGFQFGYGQYNNIRFFGDSGVTIEQIEIIPIDRLIQPEITETASDATSIRLTTNVSRADGFYRVRYGTESGEYTTTASGFRTNVANLTGLRENTTYYCKLSMLLNGRTVESEEISVTTSGSGSEADVPKAEFYDDFSDPEASARLWSPSGTPGAVTFAEGKIQIASDGNVKAVAGDEAWTDYAVEADLRTDSAGGADFGIMFRVTDVDESASTTTDSYRGYYVGLMSGAVRFGYSAYGWNLVKDTPYDIQAGKTYSVKVVTCGARILIYIDGEKACQFTDSRYENGRVGVRSWNKAFEVSSFRVRNLTEAEREEAAEVPVEPTDILYDDLVYSVYEGAQLAYKRPSSEMKIAYGTAPGVYDHVVYGINSKFASDKASVTGLENGISYYLRLSDAYETIYSPEYVFTPGVRPDLTGYAAPLLETLDEARTASQADYTDEAWARLQKAIAEAERVLTTDEPNEMDYDLAKSCLKTGLKETGRETRPALTGVAPVEGIQVGKYLSLNDVASKLPQEVEVTYGDPATTTTAKISAWRCTSYDPSVPGVYNFIGTPAPSALYVNSNRLTVSAEVTVLDNVVRYEAEDAAITAPAFVGSHPASSGGKHVQSIDNGDAAVTFTVEAPAAGKYELIVTADGHPSFPNASHKYYVNGDTKNAQIIRYPGGTGWFNWRQFPVDIMLNKGENTITFTHSGLENSFAQLDCIDLVLPVETENPTVRYEAEQGTVTAPAAVASGATSSGGQHVASIDNENATVTFTVEAPSAGMYQMAVTADGHTAFPNASHKFFINGDTAHAQLISYPNATSWGDWHTYEVTIQLSEGTNTITFTHSGLENSFAQLDCIDLTPHSVSQTDVIVTYSGRDVSLEVNGEPQKLADLTGKFAAKDVESGTTFTLTFAPRLEDRTFRAVTVNGQTELVGKPSYTYDFIAAGKPVQLNFLFELTSKTILKQTFDYAKSYVDNGTVGQLIPEVQEAFLHAYQTARDAIDDPLATQAEIDRAWTDLLHAIHYLEFKPGDKRALEDLLTVLKQLDEEDFTSETWSALAGALQEALAVMDDSEALAGDIDAACQALLDAAYALKRLADRTALDALIAAAEQTAEEIETDTYLPDGQEAFFAALKEAVSLEQDASQRVIDAAAQTLTEAMAALRKRADKTELKVVLNALKKLRPADYTKQSYAHVAAAIADLEQILTDDTVDESRQDTIDSAVKHARTARNSLVPAGRPVSAGNKNSQSLPPRGNSYGASGIVSAQGSSASVHCDTTTDFTLTRGHAYCFKMTASGTTAPSFTVGNGQILKTQFAVRIGSDYYFRVYAIGTPGQSTGVYTATADEKPQRHCVVTIV